LDASSRLRGPSLSSGFLHWIFDLSGQEEEIVRSRGWFGLGPGLPDIFPDWMAIGRGQGGDQGGGGDDQKRDQNARREDNKWPDGQQRSKDWFLREH